MTEPKLIKILELMVSKSAKLNWSLESNYYICEVSDLRILIKRSGELTVEDNGPLTAEFNADDTRELRVQLFQSAHAAFAAQREAAYDEVMKELDKL